MINYIPFQRSVMYLFYETTFTDLALWPGERSYHHKSPRRQRLCWTRTLDTQGVWWPSRRQISGTRNQTCRLQITENRGWYESKARGRTRYRRQTAMAVAEVSWKPTVTYIPSGIRWWIFGHGRWWPRTCTRRSHHSGRFRWSVGPNPHRILSDTCNTRNVHEVWCYYCYCYYYCCCFCYYYCCCFCEGVLKT